MIKKYLSVIYNLMASANPMLAGFALIVSTLLATFSWLNNHITYLFTQIDAMTVTTFPSVHISPAGFLNTFVPLSEAITFFTAWLGVAGFCAIIRLVKAWIPFVST